MKWPKKFINHVIQENCLKILKEIPNDSIDLVLTDPPYMISSTVRIKRQRNPMKFGEWRGKGEKRKDYKYKGKDISFEFGDWDIFPSLEDYLEFSEKWFTEAIRVLRKGGHIISFWDKHKLTYIVNWANKLSVKNRQCIFWIKTNPVPCARKVNFMSAVELAYWGTKETTERKFCTFNYELGQHRDYFQHSIVARKSRKDGIRIHPCQKPVAMMEWLISYLSNPEDIVLDCFAGSGTTLVAARNLGRKFIGIEIKKNYCEEIKKRLSQGVFEF